MKRWQVMTEDRVSVFDGADCPAAALSRWCADEGVMISRVTSLREGPNGKDVTAEALAWARPDIFARAFLPRFFGDARKVSFSGMSTHDHDVAMRLASAGYIEETQPEHGCEVAYRMTWKGSDFVRAARGAKRQ